MQASGSTGYTPANLATSYVYTFVNDIGEESAPSPASATIPAAGWLRCCDDAVWVPSGVSSPNTTSPKRIYRVATGNTGTQFLFVAEIALATATYEDTLTDAAWRVLESTGWDLPPDDLEGILALPNGIMVGFRRNQLCLSAQNRPACMAAAVPAEHRHRHRGHRERRHHGGDRHQRASSTWYRQRSGGLQHEQVRSALRRGGGPRSPISPVSVSCSPARTV